MNKLTNFFSYQKLLLLIIDIWRKPDIYESFFFSKIKENRFKGLQKLI